MVLGQLAVVVHGLAAGAVVVGVGGAAVVVAGQRRLGVPPAAAAHVALLVLGIALRLGSSAVQLVVGMLAGNVLAEGL